MVTQWVPGPGQREEMESHDGTSLTDGVTVAIVNVDCGYQSRVVREARGSSLHIREWGAVVAKYFAVNYTSNKTLPHHSQIYIQENHNIAFTFCADSDPLPFGWKYCQALWVYLLQWPMGADSIFILTGHQRGEREVSLRLPVCALLTTLAASCFSDFPGLISIAPSRRLSN